MEIKDVIVTLVDDNSGQGHDTQIANDSSSFFFAAAHQDDGNETKNYSERDKQDLSMLNQNGISMANNCAEQTSPYLVVPPSEDSMYRVSQRSGNSAGNQGSNFGDNE